MEHHVDYFITAVRMQGGHVTHLRVHKALPGNGFAPHGVVQPRSKVILNIRGSQRIYKTLGEHDGRRGHSHPVHLVEVANRFYLKTNGSEVAGDALWE